MTDMRKYQKQTNRRLLFGFILLLFTVGNGLIYLIYGRSAAVVGLICMIVAFVPVGLVMLYLGILNWVAKKANEA